MSLPSIAVITGGIGSERAVSLKTGTQVYTSLAKCFPTTWIELHADLGLYGSQGEQYTWQGLQNFDFVYIAIHGAYGEDGKIQSLLEAQGIEYNGSSSQVSIITIDKYLTQTLVGEHGIDVPQTVFYQPGDTLDTTEFTFPVVIKPNAEGSSIGVSIADNQSELDHALQAQPDTALLIQEYITGQEFSCGVMKNSDQDPLYTLPPVEIITSDGNFDYQAKYQSQTTQEICPPDISSALSQRIIDQATAVHEILGCRGLTRSDFRYDATQDRLVFLEINTIPGQTQSSLAPQEAQAVGVDFDTFIQDQVHLGQSNT